MSYYQIKHNPIVRALSFPAIFAARYWRNKVEQPRESIYINLCKILQDDPVIFLQEFQGKFFVDVRSDIFRRILLNGEYEPKVVESCIQYTKKNSDVIDIGANIGFFTTLFARIIDDSQKVLSVEPTKTALARLHKNIRINSVEEKVVIFEGVVSDKLGIEKISVIEGKEEYSSIGEINHPSVANMNRLQYEVESVTVDELVKRYSLEPGLIKVDAEGAELSIFNGCRKTISDHRPIILSEVSDLLLKGKGATSKDLLEFFECFGYTVSNLLFPNTPLGISVSDTMLCIPKEIYG
ncbi:MAG TPA: FkbM family methyltransferase [Cyclobacteriaceae bacterium]|nr:FkbM family methyltransferase [Cyclobacteriaceae bacterium]